MGLVLPVVFMVYRKQFNLYHWDSRKRSLAIGVLLASVVAMGVIHSGNPKLLADSQALGSSAFDRAFKRTASIGADDYSLNIMQPLYQTPAAQLETDYYVHNEILQLMAEYGLVGWIFLLLLLSYLLMSAWRTLTNRTPEGLSEAPLRAIALASMLAFLIVSNIGFPWRLASTGCLFALCLALLAASDSRLSFRGATAASRLSCRSF